jgi:hypothetical protein
MNKTEKRWIKRGWLLLALGAVIAALLAGASLAAYTSVNMVKRVVSTTAGAGLRFSSNYMGAYSLDDNAYSIRTLSFAEAVSAPTYSISVCNYAQSDPAAVNESDITYTFTVTLVDRAGDPYTGELTYSSYKLNDTPFTGVSLSVSGQKLTGGERSKKVYTITVDKAHLSDVYVKVEAVPDSDASKSATEEKKLARILYGTLESAQRTAGWTGRFTDAMLDSDSSALDGFNYEISGYGAGDITLTWDNSKVTISPWFLQDHGITSVATDGTKSAVTFSVAADVETTYRLQFYRVVPAADDEQTAELVSCTFGAAAAATAAPAGTPTAEGETN